MTYDEAIEWLLSFADFERSGRFQDRPDVAPMLALLERLGNPHLERKTVHIAGSKGKGSVAAMVGCLLGEVEDHAGVYTSPHLYSYCERIGSNCGAYIAEQHFANLVDQELRPVVEAELKGLGGRQLVTFDLLTALAFLEFRAEDEEIQVLEVGLGGRVDSTNVFETKEVAVLTPISLEHTEILGSTVEQVASEKAAIVTPGCIAVMSPQPYRSAQRVLSERAAQVNATVVEVASEYHWNKLAHDMGGQNIRIDWPTGWVETKLPLLGRHQLENAATALAAVLSLRERYPQYWELSNRLGLLTA